MADVVPQGFVNYGLSQAQQGQATASANLENQQAQQVQLQNMRQAAALPMIMKMLKGGEGQVTNWDGQTNGHGSSDVAGSDYDAASDTSGAIPAGQPGVNRATGYNMIGVDAAHGNIVQGALQSKYNVDPSGTQQERNAIMQAYTRKMQIDLLGDAGLSKMAQDQLDQATTIRDMNVKSRLNTANVTASKEFEGLSSVATSDHPYQTLDAVDHGAAMRLKAQLGGDAASEAQLDAAAKQQASRTAGFMHRFTGREAVKGDDGVYRDKDTGLAIPGIEAQGFSKEQIAKIEEEGDHMDTVIRNGRETQIPHREAVYGDGTTNNQYVQRRVAEARAEYQSQNRTEQQRQVAVSTQAAAGVPPDQRIPAPGQKVPASKRAAQAAAALQPAPPAGGAAPAPAGGATTAPAGGAAPAPAGGAAPAPAGGAAPVAGTVTAGGNLTAAEQAYVRNGPGQPAFMNTGRSKPNPGEELNQRDYAKARTDLVNSADSDRTTANATLTQVARAKALLAKDPVTGPGAQTLATVQTLFQTLTGSKTAETIESNAALYQVLLKQLGQSGLGDLLGKLHGDGASVRLGAQESKLILGALSANPDMSKGAIAQMLQWEESDANYKLGRARTAKAWVAANRDPQQFNYESQFPQAQNSQTSVGVPGTTPSAKPTFSNDQVAAWAKKYNVPLDKAKQHFGIQ